MYYTQYNVFAFYIFLYVCIFLHAFVCESYISGKYYNCNTEVSYKAIRLLCRICPVINFIEFWINLRYMQVLHSISFLQCFLKFQYYALMFKEGLINSDLIHDLYSDNVKNKGQKKNVICIVYCLENIGDQYFVTIFCHFD